MTIGVKSGYQRHNNDLYRFKEHRFGEERRGVLGYVLIGRELPLRPRLTHISLIATALVQMPPQVAVSTGGTRYMDSGPSAARINLHFLSAATPS